MNDAYRLILEDDIPLYGDDNIATKIHPYFDFNKDPASLILADAKPVSHRKLPDRLLSPKLQFYMRMKFGALGPWSHQTEAIEQAVLHGRNTITTTGTGSGKSAIFMTAAFDTLMKYPDSRVVVFFPFRALGQDQTNKWHEMGKLLGFPSGSIAKIDGSIPVNERQSYLAKARIMLTTPDMFHSWVMSNLQLPVVREFIANLHLRLLDEVHEYDGVFGTNMLLMLRRLDYHQTHLNPLITPRYHGASGTLQDAEGFFTRLTGQVCTHIGEDKNGAPRHNKFIRMGRLYHDEAFTGLLGEVDFTRHQAVVFADGRKKIEEMAHQFKIHATRYDIFGGLKSDLDDQVLVYKAGLPAAEYDRLHTLIANKTARIVFATSALEAGVDVDFTIGMNLGVPLRKSELLQRMGRIGRREESCFIVFNKYGARIDSPKQLAEYLNDPNMEAPVLYDTNRCLQISASACLLSERSVLRPYYAKDITAAAKVTWPRGFAKISQEMARNELVYEPHEAGLKYTGRRAPQHYFPLRNVPTERFELVLHQSGHAPKYMGDIAATGALKEFTPGLITRHMGKNVRVQRWQEKEGGRNQIILTPYKGDARTHVSIYVSTKISLNEKRIIGGSFRRHLMEHPIEGGFIAGVQAQVTSSANGFREVRRGKEKLIVNPYRYFDDHELAKVQEIKDKELIDYGPKRHIENYTMGVLLHIPNRWFGEYVRKTIGEEILAAYAEKNRISPRDLDFTTKNISAFWGEGQRLRDHCLFFYETEGAQIGLLEKLPDQLRAIVRNIRDSKIPEQQKPYDHMLRFLASLIKVQKNEISGVFSGEIESEQITLPENVMPVFAPHSKVKIMQGKTIQRQVELVMPVLRTIFNEVSGTSENIPGYIISEIDRKKFYNSGRWVSVSTQNKYGIEALMKKLREDSERADTVMQRHFIPASRIVTPLYRPEIVMNIQTGALSSVSREWGNVELDDYHLPLDLQHLRREM